jgi:site-specific DNA-methyltransferase (adenine-specific)
LHLATETKNKNHSAVFPEGLPEWFIKLFTKEGDWVLDPFMGSGTTIRVAQRMNRNGVGIEILPDYYQLAHTDILPHLEMLPAQLALLEKKGDYETTKPD